MMPHPTVKETEEFVKPYFLLTFDHGGDSFFNHLRRVVNGVEDMGEDYIHAAWLHDIVEDHPVTLEDLDAMGYSLRIIEAVDLLTKPKDMKYPDYIDRLIASKNKIALAVKISDQQDNTDMHRSMYLPTGMRIALSKRYAGVMPRLLAAAAEVF